MRARFAELALLSQRTLRGDNRIEWRLWAYSVEKLVVYGWCPDETGKLPFHHAWCVEPSTRNIVDATWRGPEQCLYSWVHVPIRALIEILNQTKTFGILGFWIKEEALSASSFKSFLAGMQERRGDKTICPIFQLIPELSDLKPPAELLSFLSGRG